MKRNGGEGGIRTPDGVTPMPDFESGAFNRALPPLRVLSYLFLVFTERSRFAGSAWNRPVSVLLSLPFPEFTRLSTADA
jgi:hypothetical protein